MPHRDRDGVDQADGELGVFQVAFQGGLQRAEHLLVPLAGAQQPRRRQAFQQHRGAAGTERVVDDGRLAEVAAPHQAYDAVALTTWIFALCAASRVNVKSQLAGVRLVFWNAAGPPEISCADVFGACTYALYG